MSESKGRDIFDHILSAADVSRLANVSKQRVYQAVKTYEMKEKGLAKMVGSRLMLLPDVVEIIKSKKGQVGNPDWRKKKKGKKVPEGAKPLYKPTDRTTKPKENRTFRTGPQLQKTPQKGGGIFIDD